MLCCILAAIFGTLSVFVGVEPSNQHPTTKQQDHNSKSVVLTKTNNFVFSGHMGNNCRNGVPAELHNAISTSFWSETVSDEISEKIGAMPSNERSQQQNCTC